MNADANNQGKPDNKTDKLEERDIDSYIRYLPKHIENLRFKTNILPKVDAKGNSECPVAEDLFFKKEEAHKKLANEVAKGGGYVNLLNKKISRLRQDLNTIIADARLLTGKEARKKFVSAREAQRFHINENIKKQEKLWKIIREANEMLNLSRKKQWPLGKPKERMNFPMMSFGKPIDGTRAGTDQSRLSGPLSTSPQIKADIGNLIGMGPITPPKV